MKKCLKCGKVYDKTWGVCMKCNVTLHSLMICPHCEKEYFQGEKKCLSCDVALISADQRPLSGNFLVTTTSVVDGKKVKKYLGIVNGFCITGFGMFREIAASFTDILGGKSGSYQKEYDTGKQLALEDLVKNAKKLSANGVIGLSLDFEHISSKGTSFAMVVATGTAVLLEDLDQDQKE